MGLSLGFGGTECGDLVLFQAMVKIEDMAVSLILEEWGCQNLARRNLNRDTRQENYGNGCRITCDKSVLLLFPVAVGSLMC